MRDEQYYECAWKSLKKNLANAQNNRLTEDARKTLGVVDELIKMEEKSIENYKWFFKSFPELDKLKPTNGKE